MRMLLIAIAVVTLAFGGAVVARRSPGFECPVTMPDRPGFVPPEPWHADPSTGVWYGTESLWTSLPADGDYPPRKAVFWSANFPGGALEPQPDLEVGWRRLDVDRPSIVAGAPGTNAHTPEDGWFMIAGIDPDEPGCWEVTARYKSATLTYVYLR